MINGLSTASLLNDKKIVRDVKELKSRATVSLGKGKTVVLAVVSSFDSINNKIIIAPCKSGIHVCNAVYDVTKDSFVVEGVDVYTIGDIPVHYFIEMEGVQGFRVHLPLPETVVKRYLTKSEKKKFENWKSKFPKETHTIKLLQMVTSHG